MCRMGWRATFSTVMNERYKHDRHIINSMLAHEPKNVVKGVYNRAEHLERRTELAEAWADLIMIDQMPMEDLLNLRRLPARDDGKDLIQASISDCSQRTVFGPKLRGAGKVPSAIRRYMVEVPRPVFCLTSRSRNRRSSVSLVIATHLSGLRISRRHFAFSRRQQPDGLGHFSAADYVASLPWLPRCTNGDKHLRSLLLPPLTTITMHNLARTSEVFA